MWCRWGPSCNAEQQASQPLHGGYLSFEAKPRMLLVHSAVLARQAAIQEVTCTQQSGAVVVPSAYTQGCTSLSKPATGETRSPAAA